ncbi:MAG: hypothetical protein IIA82_09850 [Thaumarchaeota archaeon]|nr:hypothetical protein [Nitrososphaerota archaeon]
MDIAIGKKQNLLKDLQGVRNTVVFVQSTSQLMKSFVHVVIESIEQRKEVDGNQSPLKYS